MLSLNTYTLSVLPALMGIVDLSSSNTLPALISLFVLVSSGVINLICGLILVIVLLLSWFDWLTSHEKKKGHIRLRTWPG